MEKKITIFAPAYNEEEVIGKFINQLEKEVTVPHELLIVNDGSTDQTKKIIENLQKKYKNLHLVNHPKNMGLGGAIQTGIKSAKGWAIVALDCDLTHPYKLIPQMLKELETHDSCFGSRYVKGGGMENIPLWRVFISVLANFGFALIFGMKVKDITSGFRAYKSSSIKRLLPFKNNGFAIQLEISVRMAKAKMSIAELPIVLINRSVGSSKFNFFKMIPGYAINIAELFIYRWFT